MNKRNSMPKKEKIAEYWLPILIRMGLEIDYELVNNIQCFTCGRYGQKLERAHITPICEGGTNELKNLHVLCAGCHHESEQLKGKQYWKWYRYKREIGVGESIRQFLAIYT